MINNCVDLIISNNSTDLNVPNGSRDISTQSQEFEQDGSRHFEGFQPHFQKNLTSQTQSCKKTKKLKCNISAFFCSICLKFSGLLGFSKRISLDFKFSCFGIYNKNNKPLFKNKGLLFSYNKKSVSSILFQKTILRAVIIQLYCFRLFFENTFVFSMINNCVDFGCHSNEI